MSAHVLKHRKILRFGGSGDIVSGPFSILRSRVVSKQSQSTPSACAKNDSLRLMETLQSGAFVLLH
jgi:hypothetical protein